MAQPVTAIGELVVIALKAENLPNRVATGRQDPFCIFKLGSTVKKTKTDQNGGKNPIWDDQINFPVPQGITRLFVQVFHRQASKETLISEGHVDLHQVLRQGEHDGFFPLVMNGTKAGQIYLELTFYAGPVHRQPSRHYRPPPPMNRPPMPQPRPYAPPIQPMMNHAHTSVRPLPPTPYRPPSTTPPVRYTNPPHAGLRPPNQTSRPANPPPAGFRPPNQTSRPANPPPAGFHPPNQTPFSNTNPPPAGLRPPNQIPLPANGYPPRPSPSSFHGYHPPRPWPPQQQQPYPPYPRPPAPF